jgi:hypothetical protein
MNADSLMIFPRLPFVKFETIVGKAYLVAPECKSADSK